MTSNFSRILSLCLLFFLGSSIFLTPFQIRFSRNDLFFDRITGNSNVSPNDDSARALSDYKANISEPLGHRRPITNYTIIANLDHSIHVVNAITTITYVNHANDSLDELIFHLYPNAFLDDGYITTHAVRYQGVNLAYTFSGTYWDLLTVDLNSPFGPGVLNSGSNVTLELQYSVHVPNLWGRFGWFEYLEDSIELLVYNLGNWHPIIAVYDERGWHTASYTFMGESFYSDVATYDVYLTVPENFVVAATGELQEITQGTGTQTWHWMTGPVRDFTWCASPHFQTESINVHGVNVTSYFTTGHTEGGLLALEVADRCLDIFGSLFGPYVWSSLHIVETTSEGGMEYPQLIMIRTQYYDQTEELSALEIVVVHEIGHEWVPFSIGTDSHAEPWIDEGFASFSEIVYAEFAYNQSTQQNYRLSDLAWYWYYVDNEGDKCINQSISFWEQLSWFDYSNIVYRKAALVYEMLRHQIGNSTFYQAWLYIYQQTLHRNIRASELQRMFEEVAGISLEWFFNQWVFGSGIISFRLGSAITYQDDVGWTLVFQIHQTQESPISLYMPITITTITGNETYRVWVTEEQDNTYTLSLNTQPLTLYIDPDSVLLCQYTLRWVTVFLSPTSPLFQQIIFISVILLVVIVVVVVGLWLLWRYRFRR